MLGVSYGLYLSVTRREQEELAQLQHSLVSDMKD